MESQQEHIGEFVSAHTHMRTHTFCDDISGPKSPGPSKLWSSLAMQSELKMMGYCLNATLSPSEIENQMVMHVSPLININAMLVL